MMLLSPLSEKSPPGQGITLFNPHALKLNKVRFLFSSVVLMEHVTLWKELVRCVCACGELVEDGRDELGSSIFSWV